LGVRVCNVDIKPPMDAGQSEYWVEADILNREGLARVFRDVKPTHVLHLAGRTDCVEGVELESAYAANIAGSASCLDAIKATPSVQRVIIASTQYVCGPGRLPEHDRDYFPHTVYGQSKVLVEDMTRAADLSCVWTLIRPTNIWGPWHPRYSEEAWAVIRRGFYMHPADPPVVRCYGYVGNVVWQMRQILEADSSLVNGQVIYLGDRPIDIYQWVDQFSLRLRGQHARKVPRGLLRAIALAGDVVQFCGMKSPLTSSRYRSMTQDHLTPMDKVFDLFGDPPYELDQGVAETCRWLRHHVGGIYGNLQI